MRIVFFILARLVMALVALVQPAQAGPQEILLGERFYLIDLPDQPSGAMIFALHGGGGNPGQFAGASGLSAPALAQGYAVIYPAGSGPKRLLIRGLLTWNAGYCCGYASDHGLDDVGFLDAVAADAASRFGLDASRVYVTGISNGAMMAERFASEGATKLKAVAAVAGTMDLDTTPNPRPVPLLVIHGTADDHVAYLGGPGAKSREQADFTAVASIIAAWRQVLEAQPTGKLTERQSRIDRAEDGMRVLQSDFVDASGAVPLRLLTVEGGGHSWPGGKRAPKQQGTHDITANTEILRFFALWP